MIENGSNGSIYKSPLGKQKLLDLYDRHLNKLKISFEEKNVQTRYGTTHVIIVGNKNSLPVICLHGGNSNTPDMLKSDLPLVDKAIQGKVMKLGYHLKI